MMTLTQASIATIDELTDELTSACRDSSQTETHVAREAVARLIHETQGPYDLCDENNDTIREATIDEVIASVLAGPEGWIMADGKRCYVQG